jgi:hypothetical protein
LIQSRAHLKLLPLNVPCESFRVSDRSTWAGLRKHQQKRTEIQK